MNSCVPDWDEFSGELISLSRLDPLSTRKKSDQRKAITTAEQQHAHVPNHDTDDVNWVEGHLDMLGEKDIGRKRHVWTSETAAGGGIGHDSVPAIDVPLSNLPFHEDEMLSWFQYPLEDSFDRSYCSELFTEAPNSHLHLPKKDAFQHQLMKDNENPPGSQALRPLPSSEFSMGSKPLTVDAAMALGARRAAGILPQTGAHAFAKVRTSMHSKATPNALPTQLPPPSPNFPSPATSHASAISIPSQIGQPPALNFPLFSHPAAATKAGLEFVGGCSGLTNIGRARQPLVTPEKAAFASLGLQCAGTSDFPTNVEGARQAFIASEKEALASGIASTAGSTTTVTTGIGSSRQFNLTPQERGTKQCRDRAPGGRCSPSILLCRQDLDRGKEAELGNQIAMNLSESSVPASEKGTGTLETADLTSSPSRGSGNSTEKSAKEAAVVNSKKRTHPAEEFEYQSEDMEEVVANAKKPSHARTSQTKRARAAEIHNQSERRRRDKINERMKALQELIPNANKTDKASMLDEAIEYLKLLQAQLQFMSMRTGMVVPPMMIPPGIQYLPMQQMPAVACMGMGMGLGMNMMDVSAAGASAGCAVVALPPVPGHPLPGHAYHVAGFQPSNSPSIIHEAQGRMQASRVNEAYSIFPAQQQPQPMHLNMQMNVDMYNDFMHRQQHTREC